MAAHVANNIPINNQLVDFLFRGWMAVLDWVAAQCDQSVQKLVLKEQKWNILKLITILEGAELFGPS